MPYELVQPEGEEKIMPDASFSAGGTDAGDAGYSDSFRALKSQMDFVLRQYNDQLASIPYRKMKLRKELIRAWISVAVFLLAIPIGMWVLTDILMNVGTGNGFFAILYLIFKLLFFPVCFLSLFIALPPAIRTLINCQRRYNAFMNPAYHAAYRDKYDIVSFGEEEHFLRQMQTKHEQFEERIRREHLDEPGGGEGLEAQEDLTEKQRATLAEMQEMTIFKDYQARIGVNRVEGDSKWVFLGIGVGIFIAACGFTMVV